MRTIVPATLAVLGCLVIVSVAGASTGAIKDPSFSPGPSLPVGTVPAAVTVGDFDANGSADLAIADYGYEQNLRILLNDGAGRFRVAAGSPFDFVSGPPASADFNGDGKADLAVPGDKLHILLGDGTGRVGEAPGSPIGIGGGPAYGADLNRDGSQDLVEAVPQGRKYRFKVLLNDGTGRFTVLGAIPPVTVKSDYFSFAVTDLSGDGIPDLAAAEANSPKIAVLLGEGTGAFRSAARFAAGKNRGKLVVGDFNGDGKADLAEPVGSGVAVLLGTGAGRFRPGSRLRGFEAYDLAVADLDRDGRSDLVAGATVLLGTGSGKLRPARPLPSDAGEVNLVATADFDGDSKVDILALAGSGFWWPTQRGNVILFQTPSEPQIEHGRSLPARVDAVLPTRKPIDSLAADGQHAAACLDTYRHRGFVVWTAPRRKSFDVRASCYDGEFALARGRLAWIVEWALPNQPELKRVVYEERLSDHRRRVIAGIENESNHGDLRGGWLGQLLGGGSLLAWNYWELDCLPPPPPLCDADYCAEGCEAENPTVRISGEGLAIANRRRVRVHSGSDLFPLRAIGGGRLATTPGAAVAVVAPNGSRVATVPAVDTDPPREVALSRTRMAVTRRSTLDVYDPATGTKLSSFALGPAAALKLVGVNSKIALLGRLHELVLVRLSDGKLVSMPLRPAAARGLVDAKLTAAGLFYAYNLPRGVKRGRIVFEPTAKLLARF